MDKRPRRIKAVTSQSAVVLLYVCVGLVELNEWLTRHVKYMRFFYSCTTNGQLNIQSTAFIVN